MPDGTGSPEQGLKEPQVKYEIVMYENGQLGVLMTGEPGAKYKWDDKWSPTLPFEQGEAIVSTKGGDKYYLYEDGKGGVVVVDIAASMEKGKGVGAYKPQNIPFATIKFGNPWELPSYKTTSEVESVLIRYKIANPNSKDGRKLNLPDPFEKARKTFRPKQATS